MSAGAYRNIAISTTLIVVEVLGHLARGHIMSDALA